MLRMVRAISASSATRRSNPVLFFVAIGVLLVVVQPGRAPSARWAALGAVLAVLVLLLETGADGGQAGIVQAGALPALGPLPLGLGGLLALGVIPRGALARGAAVIAAHAGAAVLATLDGALLAGLLAL